MKRRDILEKIYGVKDEKSLTRILDYCKNRFTSAKKMPMSDEAFAIDWANTFKSKKDMDKKIKEYIIEANFPIKKGISKREDHKRALNEGVIPKNIEGLKLDTLSVDIIGTPGGKIPTITFKDRDEFENLIRAISYNNEPVKLPKSMGASTYSNYINWGRVREYRENWSKGKKDIKEVDWAKEFARLESKTYLYEDRFIILSSNFYSNVSPKDLGLDISDKKWEEISLEIRKYHEVTHYFTKRVLGSMANNAIDEILCDYVGLVKATGSYSSEKALAFLGLEGYPKYRKGGRLENYLSGLEKEDLTTIHSLVHDAVKNIDLLHRKGQNPFIAVLSFAKFSLEELATYPGLVMEELKKNNEKYGGKI